MSQTTKDKIKQEARELGFDLVGITSADALSSDHAQHLETWLEQGYAGDMAYMSRNVAKRIDPEQLLSGAQTVIVVGLNYKHAATNGDTPKAVGRVCRYAQYEDYHLFLKQRLYQLSGYILSVIGGGVRFKVCVDTVPLAERSLAQRAGLGFIGRNHMLIHPELGPELFLGEIVITASLEPDKPIVGDCGSCRRCLDACPTGALRDDGFLDASRCINYLTIEHEGDIDPARRAAIGDRLYGCDECVRVCPYHQKAPCHANSDLKENPNLSHLDLTDVITWNQEDFLNHMKGTAIERIGLKRFLRNAHICVDNLIAKARTQDT